jgi:hypothetical protein
MVVVLVALGRFSFGVQRVFLQGQRLVVQRRAFLQARQQVSSWVRASAPRPALASALARLSCSGSRSGPSATARLRLVMPAVELAALDLDHADGVDDRGVLRRRRSACSPYSSASDP